MSVYYGTFALVFTRIFMKKGFSYQHFNVNYKV